MARQQVVSCAQPGWAAGLMELTSLLSSNTDAAHPCYSEPIHLSTELFSLPLTPNLRKSQLSGMRTRYTWLSADSLVRLGALLTPEIFPWALLSILASRKSMSNWGKFNKQIVYKGMGRLKRHAQRFSEGSQA